MNSLGIALIVAAVMLMPYWLAPIRVRFGRRMVNRPTMVPYDPSHHHLPQALNEFIERASGALVPLGFDTVADLWRADTDAMRVVLMRDAKTGEEASLVALRGDAGRGQTLIEFTTKFADGRELNVNNFGLGVFAPVPRKITERFPAVTDPASLCRISRELIRRHYGGMNVTPPDDGGDPAAYLTAAMRSELTKQVATGYFWWDEGGQAFRPTWRGALLMTWKLLPPFRQVRESRMRRRADRLMKEAGDSNRAVS